jgi:uncharacterized protein (DUF697 family)
MDKKIQSIDFEKLLQTSASLPLVHIDRDDFLKNELKRYCDDYTIELAVKNNPAYAKIPAEIIDKIADGCIKFETLKVSTLSFTAGLPGGLAMAATVPADLAQYYAHVLRVIQKLAYLYGWENLINKKGSMDDETSQLLTLFTGVMFGVKGATTVVTKISQSMAERVGKTLANKALTKGAVYPIVKKMAQILGVRMTKEIFAKGVSKVIPIVGGVVSGGITFASFMPMSKRFKDYLSGLDIAKVEYYENNKDNRENEELIDVDFSDIDIDDIK